MRRRRIEGAVDAATLGVGERVTVVTRLGHPVAEGVVEVASPVGLVVRGSNGVAFFREDVYLFLPRAVEGAVPRHLWVDRAVLREQNARATPGGESPVSVEDLPQDIRQVVTPKLKLDDDGVQLVLTAVGDATLGALKRAGAPAGDLYGLVDAIQQAVMGVLGQYAEQLAASNEEVAAEEAPTAEEAPEDEAGDDADEDGEDAGAVEDATAALSALGV